jgi:hypothetical protein
MAKRPVLGHTIATLLDVAGRGKIGRDARVAAVHALSVLLRAVGTSKRRALAFFLPGLLSALTRLASSDQRTGSRLISAALEAWMLTAVLVLGHLDNGRGSATAAASPEEQLRIALERARGDTRPATDATLQVLTARDDNAEDDDDIMDSSSEDEGEELASRAGAAPHAAQDDRLHVRRDRTWWRKAEENAVNLLGRLLRVLPAHDNPRARAAAGRLCGALLAFCSQTLPSAIPHALDTLALLSMDSLAEVRSAAVVSLAQLQCSGEMSRDLDQSGEAGWRAEAARRQMVSRLLPVVHQRLIELPRICKRGTDEELYLTLRRLEAVFSLLGPAAVQLLDDPEAGKRLCAGLVQVLKLDMDAYHFMVDDGATLAAGVGAGDEVLRRVFVHFRGQGIEKAALRLCFMWTRLGRAQGMKQRKYRTGGRIKGSFYF